MDRFKDPFAASVEREIAMLCLLVLGLLVASIPIYRSQLKAAALIDFTVAMYIELAEIAAIRFVDVSAADIAANTAPKEINDKLD